MHIHWYEQKRQIHQENHFQINGHFQWGNGAGLPFDPSRLHHVVVKVVCGVPAKRKEKMVIKFETTTTF
jgi:hypothetical protein